MTREPVAEELLRGGRTFDVDFVETSHHSTGFDTSLGVLTIERVSNPPITCLAIDFGSWESQRWREIG